MRIIDTIDRVIWHAVTKHRINIYAYIQTSYTHISTSKLASYS